MGKESLGFHSREREMTELERELGASFLDDSEEIYCDSIGKSVEIKSGGQSYFGVYRGMNKKG